MEYVECASFEFLGQFLNNYMRLRNEHIHKSLQDPWVESRHDEFPVNAPGGHCVEKRFAVEQPSCICQWPEEHREKLTPGQ